MLSRNMSYSLQSKFFQIATKAMKSQAYSTIVQLDSPTTIDTTKPTVIRGILKLHID
ncbi:hypothetical protein CJ030_MR4G004739 [Morella rubra]|uniref:Uncharacterized protein n=1 Tax=Morella rubra TaxID=262757 RepID=A0A6A1VS14_9ROSI|nr:hypothetical protein CJ030_MR4G004739 [Morella rubra]